MWFTVGTAAHPEMRCAADQSRRVHLDVEARHAVAAPLAVRPAAREIPAVDRLAADRVAHAGGGRGSAGSARARAP